MPLIERIIRAIYASVAAAKKEALEREMASDPQMKQYHAELDVLRGNIEKTRQKHEDEVVNDPEWLKTLKELGIEPEGEDP